jgi:hypothetical protein
VLAVEVSEDGTDFCTGEHYWKAFRLLRSFHLPKRGDVPMENFSVQENESA